jgi:alpha-L-fucosidase
LDLTAYFNNKAFGTYPGEADFNGLNESYPASTLLAFPYRSNGTGILYALAGYTGRAAPDNVVCSGETIDVPVGSYFSASFLVAGDLESASVSANVTFVYTDNSTSEFELRSLNWFNFLTINCGEIIFQSRYTGTGINYNTSHIFERTSSLATEKQLSAIVLPQTTNVTEGRLHIFAISLWQGSSIAVQSVRPTQKWLSDGTQAVEVTLNNAGHQCISGHGLTVSIGANGVETRAPGSLRRLCPGDQKIVTVGVAGVSDGPATANVAIDDGMDQWTTTVSNLEFGFIDWSSDLDVLSKHESPAWFDGAKFGIFIHWGPYSVTG